MRGTQREGSFTGYPGGGSFTGTFERRRRALETEHFLLNYFLIQTMLGA